MIMSQMGIQLFQGREIKDTDISTTVRWVTLTDATWMHLKFFKDLECFLIFKVDQKILVHQLDLIETNVRVLLIPIRSEQHLTEKKRIGKVSDCVKVERGKEIDRKREAKNY